MLEFTISHIIELASMLTVFGGAYHTLHKIKRDHKEDRQAHKDEILNEVEAADLKLSKELHTRIDLLLKDGEAKFNEMRKDLDSMVRALESEIDHIKEKQAGEIRNLGEKIEDLRSELRTQHGQLIALVTKLIDKA